MELNIDSTIEGKITYAFKNDMRNSANFHQSMFESLKIGTLMGSFIQGRKCMSLKFTGKFCAMKINNFAKFGEKSTGQFKIDMRNLTNFDPEHSKILKISTLMGSFEQSI